MPDLNVILVWEELQVPWVYKQYLQRNRTYIIQGFCSQNFQTSSFAGCNTVNPPYKHALRNEPEHAYMEGCMYRGSAFYCLHMIEQKFYLIVKVKYYCC